ncbi:hypothetical protein GCM10009804_71020 [Kribbella hippodromi]|uniref:Mitomycin resistance protein n=1 Tax=Kribbella hippodromi TaxID=434347 RepID=A0ABP4QF01_9ACTN
MGTKNSSDLTDLMNVGPAVARRLARAEVTEVRQLVGRDPVELYETICERDGQRHDPCLLDTIMSAVDQANGNPGRPWWSYTPERKELGKC